MVKINEFHNQESENLYPQPDYDVAADLMIFMREDPIFYRRKYFPALEDFSDAANSNRKKEREQNIQPGTEEWFKLWFSLPGMTGSRGFRGRKK